MIGGEGRHKCQVNLPLAFMAIFSWCSSRVLPLIAILLLALLAVHRLIIFHERNFLDDCYHVYLDMGTNTGIQVVCMCMMFRFNFFLIQIRKLYQPHLFPEAQVLPVFDKFFGPPSERFAGNFYFFLFNFLELGRRFVQLAGNQTGSTLEPLTDSKKASTSVDGG